MADQYGRDDDRYRRVYEQDEIRRTQDSRRYGPAWYADDAPGPYSQRAEGPSFGPPRDGYAEDYRDDARRGPRAARPYSHARYLHEREHEEHGHHRGEHHGRGPSDYVRPDERIHEDVNEHLAHDGWLDASDIRVKVQKGEVTLGGLVGSREDKRRAEHIADAVYGVKHTQNNLRVRDSSVAKPGDEKFKEAKSDYDDGSGRTN